ncbi:hypothetical protein XENTR_v10019500 [Xenopus tropicalis]|nr:hypothetical protein XENTR_v10019500 [Xenopus tropicalis]
MAKCTALLLVLISCAASVYTHECVTCSQTSLTTDAKSLTCSGSKQSCKEHQDHCVTRYFDEKDNNGKLIQGWIVRECGTSHDCFDALSFTNGTTVILMSVECCVLDICLLEDPPSKGKQPKNPLKCEVCYENGQSDCYTNKTMVCDGEHSKCASISYSSTDTTNNKVTEQFFTRGCAEEKKCSNKTITAQVGNTKYQFGYTCNGCSGLYFSPLMLVLAAISMIKLI